MSYDILFQQALQAHEQGNFDAAEKIYRQILQTAPNNPDVLNLLGLVAQAKNVHNEAVELFYKAIKQAPKHAPFYFNLAISLSALDKDVEALDNLQRAIELAPDEKEIYNRQGLVLQKLNRIEEAQQAFIKALQLDPNYSEAKTNLAMTYINSDKNKAIAFLQEIANQFPQDGLSRYYLATLSFDNNDLQAAQKYALEAQKIFEESDEISLILGLIALKQKNIAEAKENFAASLKINPHNVAAMLNLANIETNEQLFAEAEKKYKQALDLEPNNIDAHLNYANMLYLQNRLNEALDEYRAVILLNPKSAAASNNIGVILRDLGTYDDALGLFFNAFALDQTKEEYSLNIAETLVLFYRQDPENAKKIAQNWLKNAPNNIYAQHTCASFNGEKIENNKVYTEKLFDNFADNYELVLKRIDYSLPRSIRELAGNVEGAIVDLGCGSGLVGQALKTPQNHIIGVDISRNMINQAAKKGVYKQLVKGDVVAFCQKKLADIKPSLVVLADVLGYIGNLAPLFEALKGYKTCFSIELSADGDYKLNEAGRFIYNPQYVENVLQQNGFKIIAKKETVLRKEDGKDVNGLLYLVQ